jgi:hypothetical protein
MLPLLVFFTLRLIQKTSKKIKPNKLLHELEPNVNENDPLALKTKSYLQRAYQTSKPWFDGYLYHISRSFDKSFCIKSSVQTQF